LLKRSGSNGEKIRANQPSDFLSGKDSRKFAVRVKAFVLLSLRFSAACTNFSRVYFSILDPRSSILGDIQGFSWLTRVSLGKN